MNFVERRWGMLDLREGSRLVKTDGGWGVCRRRQDDVFLLIK